MLPFIKNILRYVKKVEPDKVTIGIIDGAEVEEEVFIPLV